MKIVFDSQGKCSDLKRKINPEGRLKICLTANGGGHLEQLKQLNEIINKNDIFFVVMNTEVNRGLKYRHYFVLESSRTSNFSFAIKTVINTIISIRILLMERPDIIISTGAGATIPICILGKKLFHKRLIFIESFAKKNAPSRTGKLLYRYADLFIIQWEEMKKFYPQAVYGGWIY